MRLSTAPLKKLLEQPVSKRRVGQFELVRPLGRGGHAPVWLAREMYGATELRLVAVKLFPLHAGKSESGASHDTQRHQVRVVEEAKALCRVEHPSIARFYSIARDDAAEVLGVAMEYLTGTSLESRISEEGPLPVDEALLLGASIASALSAVHRTGLVHRDIKPANIVDSAGTYKLIDFGIAWEEAQPRESLTLPVLVDDLPLEVSSAERHQIRGAVTFRAEPHLKLTSTWTHSTARLHSGTVGYVDPAILGGDAAASPASDIYALGVVLFECVSGRHPAAVAAEAGQGLKQQVLDGREAAPKLSELLPHLPASFCSLVERMLDATPQNRPRSADWIAIELERIRGEVAGALRDLPPETVGPFRGLGRFEEGDRDIYFGRASEIAAALEMMRVHGLVSLIGPSGSGKSSLARAGVLPRVRDGALGRGLSTCDVAIVSPTRDPRMSILEALVALPSPPFSLDEARELHPAAVIAALATRAQESERGVVLFIDQLEELVTLQGATDATSRRWTADLLIAFSQTSIAGVRALVTARRDLLDALLAYAGLGKALVRGTLLVEPMMDATWSDVIQQALSAYGYELEDEALAAELLQQLRGTMGAMPLVQFALTELWHQRDTAKKRITRTALDAIGGITGSLDRHAERTVATLADGGVDAAVVREVILPLTTPRGTRASSTVEAVVGDDAAKKRALAALEEARLIVVASDGVTLAHDALLSQWHRLRSWLAEVREQRVLAEELERDAKSWALDREAISLWSKRRLSMANEVVASGHVKLSKHALAFVRASRHAEHRTRQLRGGAIAIVVALAGTSAFAYVRSVRADRTAAIERAAFEESKAALELSRRLDLETAQLELDGRQKKIDDLVVQLAQTEDPKTIQELQAKLKTAQTGAHETQDKILASLPKRPVPAARPTASVPPPAASAGSTRPKIQREP